VVCETWSQHGRLHRDPAEGPAVTVRSADGETTTEEFHVHDVLVESRDHPARIKRDSQGNIIEQEYWDGDQMIVRCGPDLQERGAP
jgi:hypothetical protein